MKSFIFLVNFLSLVFLMSLTVIAQDKSPDNQKHRSQNDISHFPVVIFDEAESADPEEREKRRAKSKRYDNRRFGLVSKKAPTENAGTAVFDSIPSPSAIPTVESELIIIGEVLNSEAHLSNNRGMVYAEFTIRIDEVLKSNYSDKKAQGSLVTADRPGGMVQYPNGKRQFIRIVENELLRKGSHYILFLTNPDQSPNYNILTGYELIEGKIYPLDSGASKKFEGMDEMSFVKTVRDNIAQSQKTISMKP